MQRLDELMELQEEIAEEIAEKQVGKVLKVIVDKENDDYFVGRTEFDSPEVDPEVYIEKDESISIGNFYEINITSANAFELFGVLA